MTHDYKKSIGNWGEQLAAGFLAGQGYMIIITNYRCRYGEIDIIGRDGLVWCFVEVKTRKNNRFGQGFESVTPCKKKHIIKVATCFLNQKGLDEAPARFDVVSIDFISPTEYRIKLIKNAFYS